MIRATVKVIRESFKAHFAPYILWDCHGTRRYVWSMAEAMQWLPYCSPNVAVVNRKTRVIELSRHQIGA